MNKNKIKLHNPVRTFALAGLVFLILVPQSSSSVEPDSGNVKKEISEIASRIVSKMTDEEKIGQVIHISIPENFLDEIAIAEIEKIKPGGIILFGKNMGTKDEIRDLTKSLQSEMKKKDLPPLLISTDQEGGRVIRAKKGVTEFPGAMATGQTGNKSFAYSIGKITSFQLNSLGINLLLAPVMDINNNPENPVINTRSYGSTLGTVSDFATLYELGAREGGAI
ncbi:MAG: beta-glucosidase, partial [Leptospira sp.]|nr:beta-glucosidase [Leptospira sp.]